MFRGKESSNRIELSRLVQDFLNFGVLGSLQLRGVVGWGWGVPPTHVHMHAHACTHVCGKHDNFMQMAASIGFLGNPLEFPMMSYTCAHACACVHVHVCGGHPLTTLTPSTHPPHLSGGPSESLKIQ